MDQFRFSTLSPLKWYCDWLENEVLGSESTKKKVTGTSRVRSTSVTVQQITLNGLILQRRLPWW